MSPKIEHPVFDHKIISYFLIAFTVIMSASVAGGITGGVVKYVISPDYKDAARGIVTAATSLVMAVAFWIYFRRDGYKGDDSRSFQGN